MVLHRVSVRAVNHDGRVRVVRSLLSHVSECGLHVLLGVVGTVGAASEDNVDVLVTVRLYDGGHTLVVDTHEAMGVFSGSHGVNGNTNRAVCSVLETYADRLVKLKAAETNGESAYRLGNQNQTPILDAVAIPSFEHQSHPKRSNRQGTEARSYPAIHIQLVARAR